MIVILFIVVNMLVMAALFAFGVYQFIQVEAKRKCRKLLAEASLDEAELSGLLAAERYEEALSRLMRAADVDRFTAESALLQWRRNAESARTPSGSSTGDRLKG